MKAWEPEGHTGVSLFSKKFQSPTRAAGNTLLTWALSSYLAGDIDRATYESIARLAGRGQGE